MIDDVQFIIGKESTQEEFFHTFNALHSAGKQIILTSDKPPKDMETLEERIRSRFEWGLMADIGAPDYETRMAILRRKVESDDMSLSDDILNYIANNIKSNIRELEGALNKLLAYSNLEKTDITMEIAMNYHSGQAKRDHSAAYHRSCFGTFPDFLRPDDLEEPEQRDCKATPDRHVSVQDHDGYPIRFHWFFTWRTRPLHHYPWNQKDCG